MSEEKPEAKVEPTNGKETPEQKPPEPPTDFKIAEVWIRSGQIQLDAPPNFWADRCRALGVLEFCKDIVKTAKVQEDKPKILPASGSILNFAKTLGNKFRRR